MLASSACPRWLLLSASLLLLHAELCLSATFHLTMRSPVGATFMGVPYNSSYDLTLQGTQVPNDVDGTYYISQVSGTRTYNGMADKVTGLNYEAYVEDFPTNLLYFTNQAQELQGYGGYFDEVGLGETASNLRTAASTSTRLRFIVFFSPLLPSCHPLFILPCRSFSHLTSLCPVCDRQA